MSPQAGWYADPTDPSALRWWDGEQWTTQTQPAPRELALAGASSMPAAAAASAAPAALAPAPPASAASSVIPTLAPLIVDPHPARTHTADPVRIAVPEPAVADRSAPVPRAEPAATLSKPAAAAHPAGTVMPRGTAQVELGAAAAAAATWVDPPSAAVSGTTSQWAGPSGGGQRNQSSRTGFSPEPSAHAAALKSERNWGKTIAVLVVVALVLGAGGFFLVPRYLAIKAQEVAAEQPNVLTHTAPAVLAGQRRASTPGAPARSAAQSLTTQGAAWAWAGTYGTRGAYTAYVASDVPMGSRADAVRAMSSRDAAKTLLGQLSKGLDAGATGSVLLGAPTEYASTVGGKTWCMPITVSGISGGYCLWTSGKEYLQVLSLPGLEQVAAKSGLTSLSQMAAVVTRTAAVKSAAK